MTDVRLKEYSSLEGVTMDFLLLDSGRLDEREELATAVRVALGTDAKADDAEVLPDPDSTDRRGWWGDYEAEEIWGGWPIGCKNWLLSRAKITDAPALEGSTLQRARQYTLDALQPFIDNLIASNAVVGAARTELQRIEVTAQLYRGPEMEINLRYQALWQEETLYEVPLPPQPTNRVIRVPFRQFNITTTAPLLRITPRAGSLVLSSTPPIVW
jgi:phage gp46-like protein